MIRIRGSLGPWPVDLSIELGAEDWQQLAAHLPAAAAPAATPAAPAAAPTASRDDALWGAALRLVEQAGEVNGPALMEQLEGLAGGAAAAKRLLVRLRHCAQVRVRTEPDAPMYCWVG
ncbi:hypothetical protein [Pseudomonas sp. NPDC007930]|uniref:hypothetical protein n=1 Tax=Pseudomonas sp. NPDC007930 TaxID=3364417 RepID=UPI0036E78114